MEGYETVVRRTANRCLVAQIFFLSFSLVNYTIPVVITHFAFPVMILGILPNVLWIMMAVAFRYVYLDEIKQARRKYGRCLDCGYDRRGHQPGDRCPECGHVPSPRD